MTDVVVLQTYPEIEEKAKPWTQRAVELVIDSRDSLDRAATMLGDIRALLKEIDESTKPVIDAANKAHKAALKQRNDLATPLELAEQAIKGKAAKYRTAEENRIASERALESARAREAQQQVDAQAKELERAGEPELADALREESATEVVPASFAPPPTAKGMVFVDRYRAEVLNLRALVEAIAKDQVPLRAVTADMVFLGQQARSLKDDLRYPGVRVLKEKTTAAR